MIRKILAVAVVASATALGACSSGPTPYQPAAGYDRGYTEQKIENERYRISFKGNSMTERDTVENYLTPLWRNGALHGARPQDAFAVRCGLGQTMTDQDVQDGRVVLMLQLAVSRPAEFIIVRVTQQTAVS